MLRVIFFVLLVLGVKVGFGENERNTRLKDELEQAKSDTATLRTYADWAYNYRLTKPDSAFLFGKHALAGLDSLIRQHAVDSAQTGVIQIKSKALIATGYAYESNEILDTARFVFEQALGLLVDESGQFSTQSKTNFRRLYAEALQCRAYLVFRQGDLETPVADLKESTRIFEELQDSLLLGLTHFKLGVVLRRSGKLVEASQLIYSALDIFTALGREKDIVRCHYFMAAMKFSMKQYDEALAGMHQVLDEYIQLNDIRGQAATCVMIAKFNTYKKSYQECITYGLRGAKLAESIDKKALAAMSYTAVAAGYLEEKNDFQLVDKYLQKALDLRLQLNDKAGIVNSYANFSIIARRQAGLTTQESEKIELANLAEKYAHQALDLIPESGDPQQKISLYALLKWVSTTKGNYKDALNWADQVKTLKDSLYNVERAKAVEEIEAKYQNKEQEHQLALKEKDLIEKELKLKQVRQVGILLFVLSVAIVLILIVMYDSHRQNRKKNLELQEKNAIIERQHREIQQQMETEKEISRNVQELSEFKQQMIGMLVHDLKNPLGGILSYEYIDDEDLRRDIVMHSSNEMLKLVENMLDVYKSENRAILVNPGEVNLNELVAGEEKALIFLLKEKNIQLTVEAGETANFTADPELIGRVLGNLLSNAIKFSPVEGRIRVRAEREDGAVRIGISNQGPSIPADKQQLIFDPFGQHELQNLGITTSTGLGLTFCQMAVEAHGGTIAVNSAEGQETEFWFTLPQSKA